MHALDEPVFAALFHKAKDLTDYRPDYFHSNETTNMALHGAFDENSTHEDKTQSPGSGCPSGGLSIGKDVLLSRRTLSRQGHTCAYSREGLIKMAGFTHSHQRC